MNALRCLACAAAVFALAAGPAFSDVPGDRSATTPLGDPLECTADVRDQVTTGPVTVPWMAPTAPGRLPRLEGYALLDSVVTSLFVPAGEEYAVRFDAVNRALRETLLPYFISPTALSAIAIAPVWLQADMELNLQYLTTDVQNDLGALLLSLPDPRTVDEVAFSIAHLGRYILSDGSFDSELLRQNAELMYEIDPELDFVEIVDYDLGGGDYYSTTRYVTVDGPDTVIVEIPREVYYWWVAMPKVSDELPLMDESVYNMFWREYLYYESDVGYPVLRDVVTPLNAVWDGLQYNWPAGRAFTDSMLAVDAIGNWCSETVPYAASGNRPIQPNVIAFEHNGNCGELQDLLCAAARTCLLPCACTMDILEDHVWCELWLPEWDRLDNWHPYQIDLGHGATRVGNYGVAYDHDHGGGKDCSCIWNWRNDGYIFDVIDHYSQVCTLTVFIDDPNGVPVDNAAIQIASEYYYSPYPLYRGTWGQTDANGVIQFLLGDNQNYYVRVGTSLGSYPLSGYASIITSSVAGEHYYWNWTTPNPMTQLAMTEVPSGIDSPWVIEVDYDLPYDVKNGRDFYADPYSWYAEKLPGGHLDFFIADHPNLNAYLAGSPFAAYEIAEGASSGYVQFHTPLPQDYYVVLSGAEHHRLYTQADVTVRLWEVSTGAGDGPPVTAFALERPYPNPFRAGGTLGFSVTGDAPVTLAVYDVSGSLVRTLADGAVGPGTHRRAWDGTDNTGRPVASGVYFARLRVGREEANRKLVLVR
jgi:hypothetical protein